MKPKKNKSENKEHISEWASKKEVVKTSFPIYFTLLCMKIFPKFLTDFVILCVALFYYIFSKRAREECKRFQKQLISHNPDSLKKISAYKQISAFAITFVEKMECWVKSKPTVKLSFCDDDVHELIDRLNGGKGAVLLVSHLGNAEIFRNLANNNDIYLDHEIPVSVLMDLSSTSNFTNTIKKVNPDFTQNIIDINSINPGTINVLTETIEQGGLVVCAADRVSKYNDHKSISAGFLGKDAPWPYGVFFLTMLLDAPVYYMSGYRTKDVSFDRKYEFHVKKSTVDTCCSRNKRETNINKLCLEYVQELENHVMAHPYQWFNFYDFWNFSEEKQA